MKKAIKTILARYLHRHNIVTSYDKLSLYAKLENCVLDEGVGVSARAEINHTKIAYLSSIGRSSKIVHTEIGKYCAISWNTTINAISHPYNNLTISAFPYVPYVGNFVEKREQEYQKVIIKNDVWIGANSVIMPGVTIGNGAVIGAGAVVTKDIPDYAIAVGVPAKVIKYRFPSDMIKRLLELQWWDIEPQVIKKNIDIWQGMCNYDTLTRLEEICKQ